MSLGIIAPEASWRLFFLLFAPCTRTNQIQGHSDRGDRMGSAAPHFTAQPLSPSLDYSQKSSSQHKQASMQTNKRAKRAMRAHTSCPYQRPDMTEPACRCSMLPDAADAAAPGCCRRPCGSVTRGNRAKTNWTAARRLLDLLEKQESTDHILLHLQRLKCHTQRTDAARSS